MPDVEPEVIYARKPVSRRMWQLPSVLWVASSIALLAASPGGFTTFNVVVAVIAPGMIFGIWLLTLYSLNRYGAITLSRDTLRVGRDTLPVSRIDPTWVRMLATRASPSLKERVLTSAGAFEVPGTETSKSDTGRLLGGAYGATLGADLVTLLLVDGTRVSAQTGDREGLLAGLLTALDG
jgi:hypothetical protein